VPSKQRDCIYCEKKERIYLEVLQTFQYNSTNSTQHWDRLHRSSKVRWKSCSSVPVSSSVTPSWMLLMSLKRLPFRTRSSSERGKICRRHIWQIGGMLDHTDRFGSKKWFHIQRPSKRAPCHARAAPIVSELLFSDTVHVYVQTLQHYKIMTLHSGAYRNKLEVDNTGSIEITNSIVLKRDFLRPDCLLPGENWFHAIVVSFQDWISNTIFLKPSQFFVKRQDLRQQFRWNCNNIHLLRSAVKGSGTNFEKKNSFSEKTLSKICLDVTCRLQDVQRVVRWLFACHAHKWLEFSPRIHCTDRKLVSLDKEHPPETPCLLKNTRNFARRARFRHI